MIQSRKKREESFVGGKRRVKGLEEVRNSRGRSVKEGGIPSNRGRKSFGESVNGFCTHCPSSSGSVLGISRRSRRE